MALNFPFNTRCSNEQLENVLLLFGFQDKCPIEFVLSRTFVLLQSKWKWAPVTDVLLVSNIFIAELLQKLSLIIGKVCELMSFPPICIK